MACEIRNIKDPYLQSLISKYGEEGMNRYFREVGEIVASGREYRVGMLEDAPQHPSGEEPMFNDEGEYQDEILREDDLFLGEISEMEMMQNEMLQNEEDLYRDEALYESDNTEYEKKIAQEEEAIAAEAKYVNFNDAFTSIDEMTGDPFSYQSMEDIDTAHGKKMIAIEMKNRLNDILQIIYKLDTNVENLERDQLAEIKKSNPDSAKIKDITDRILKIKSKIEKYRDDFDSITNDIKTSLIEKGIESLKLLYKAHEKWAVSIINQANPSDPELKAAWEAMQMWQNIQDVFSDGKKDAEIEQALIEIENAANNSEFNKLLQIAKNRISKYAETTFGFKVSEADMTSTSDITGWKRGARNLQHIPKPLINAIDQMIRRANYYTHDEVFEATKKIETLFKDAKANGVNPAILLATEDGAWTGNLVSRMSKAFYDFKDNINKTFGEAITLANNTTDQKRKWDRLRDALNVRNAKLRSMYIVNAEEVLAGNKDKVRNELIAITGDVTYADELIAKAILKYQDWVALKNFMVEDGKKSQKDIDKWIKNSSPIEYKNYIAKLNVGNDIRLFNTIDKYIIEVPLNNIKGKDTGFYNAEFKNNILSNEKALQFYNGYFDELSKYVSYLPKHLTKNIGENFLPNIKKSMLGRVFKDGASGVFSNIGKEISDSITAGQAFDSSHPNSVFPSKRIKTKYLKELDPTEKSDDLREILVEFAKMAISHKNLASMEDKILLANGILKTMKADILNPDGTYARDKQTGRRVQKGKGNLVNLEKIVDHMIDANLYGQPTNEGTPSSVKKYDKRKLSLKIIGSVNPIPILFEYEKIATKEGYEKAAKAIAESKEYGKHVVVTNEKDAAKEINLKLKLIRDQFDDGNLDKHKYEQLREVYQRTLDRMGEYIVPSKIADAFITMGALKSFSWNPIPVVANLGMGEVQLITHAGSRQDFDHSELFIGQRKAIASILKAIDADSINENKYYNLLVRFHLIPDLLDNIAMEGMNPLKPFGMMASSDYILRATTLGARLERVKIKDLTGKERKLEDAFLNNGNWNVAEFGESEDWNAGYTSETGNKELHTFFNRVKAINQMLHGNMDSENPYEYKREWIGRMVTQYRLSWLADGIDARWGERRSDQLLGRDVEGTYRTTFKFFKEHGMGKSSNVILKLMMGQGEAAFENLKISDEDRQLVIGNIRKQLMESYILIALTAAIIMLKGSIDDDDEDQEWNYTTVNMANRILTDITFYISPSSFQQITNNVVPAMGLVTDTLRFFHAVNQHFQGNEYYDNDIVFKSATRMFPAFNLYNKFEYTTSRVL